jgi:hypothetical protein
LILQVTELHWDPVIVEVTCRYSNFGFEYPLALHQLFNRKKGVFGDGLFHGHEFVHAVKKIKLLN